MSSDYVWDKTGAPDVWVQQLEHTLGSLRFEPLTGVPLRPVVSEPVAPKPVVPAPRGRRVWIPLVAGLSTAAAVLVAVGLGARALEAPSVQNQAEGTMAVAPLAEPLLAPPVAAPEVAGATATAALSDAAAVDAEERLVEPSTATPRSRRAPKTRAAPTGGSESRPVERAQAIGPGETAEPKATSKREPAKSKPSKKRSSKVTVDCVLDPSQCGDEVLPRRLSSSDIRKGVLLRLAQARRCGETHGAESGTRVKIQLKIAGATGRVRRAQALAPWADTPVGDCVAESLSRAVFPRFEAESMGAIYPITLRGKAPAPQEGETSKAPPGMSRTLGPLREKAKACGVLHDAKRGLQVKVKVWFNGKTGAVDAVKAMAPHTSSELGKCLEQMVRKGNFPRTGNADEVALVPFRL